MSRPREANDRRKANPNSVPRLNNEMEYCKRDAAMNGRLLIARLIRIRLGPVAAF
jgi:hypothetical protein